MNHNGLSPACALWLFAACIQPRTWFEPLTGLAFTRRFDKVITTPGESKQNSYTAEKFFCVPKHGVPHCRKGVDEDPSSEKAQGLCVAGRIATFSHTLWKGLCITPLLCSWVPLQTYSPL